MESEVAWNSLLCDSGNGRNSWVSAPGYQLPRDPTAVMGPRVGAWLVDAVLFFALSLVLSPFGFMGEYHDVPEGTGIDACEILRDNDEAVSCITWDDKVYFGDSTQALVQFVVTLAYALLVLVVWQGVSGATPGKLLFGLRTVGEDGQSPGIGRAFIRWILWIVDGIPFCIPGLVGFIAALSSTGHRRIGDMAAKTYVIRKGDAGRPVVVPGMAPAYAQQQYGYGTPSTYPTPGAYPGAPGTGPGGPYRAPMGGVPPVAPPSSPWATPEPGAPGGPPVAPEADTRPAPPVAPPTERPAPPVAPATPTPAPVAPPAETSAEATIDAGAEAEAEDVTPAADAADPSAVDAGGPESAEDKAEEPAPDVQAEVVAVPEAEPTPATAPTAPPTSDVGPSTPPPEATRPEYNPQWDAARGTYIQWDANRSRWLQWDDAAKEWKPL
jgi:uncharacterized RDD family membrane protein YckC